MWSALIGIAVSLGISAASIGISNKINYDNEVSAANSGSSTYEVTKAITRLLNEAEKRGQNVLSRALSKLNSAQALQNVMGSPALKDVVNKMTDKLEKEYQDRQKNLNEYSVDKDSLQQKVSGFSTLSDSYKKSKKGKAEAESLKQEAADLAQRYEQRLGG